MCFHGPVENVCWTIKLCARKIWCLDQVMRWMEQCSYIAASRIGRSGHLLIGSVDSLFFASPTRVGDIMYVTAQVHAHPLGGIPSLLIIPPQWPHPHFMGC
jgi:hypothetical protein